MVARTRHFNYEDQGTGFDSGASGYELQGRASMRTYVYVSMNRLCRRVGWISGRLDDHPKVTKALVKFIDGSDSQLVERYKLKELSEMEKVLWKLNDKV